MHRPLVKAVKFAPMMMSLEVGSRSAPILVLTLLLPIIGSLIWTGGVLGQTSYWDHKDSRLWSVNFPACKGSQQSPINIDDYKVVYDRKLGTIEFTNYENRLASKQTVKNNGRSLQVDVDGDIYISGGGLPGEYKLVQYHFHWGSGDNKLAGGEHTLNGLEYPAELHLVHYNTKYNSVGEAIDKTDGLAVLGMWIKMGKVHEPLNELINYFEDIKDKPNVNAILMASPVRLLDLLPGNTTAFYRYRGSLTTPPCFESVVWTMFKQPVQISYSQMIVFHSLMNAEYEAMMNNYRRIQPLNGRVVSSSVRVRAHKSMFVKVSAALAMLTCGLIVYMMYRYSKYTKSSQPPPPPHKDQ